MKLFNDETKFNEYLEKQQDNKTTHTVLLKQDGTTSVSAPGHTIAAPALEGVTYWLVDSEEDKPISVYGSTGGLFTHSFTLVKGFEEEEIESIIKRSLDVNTTINPCIPITSSSVPEKEYDLYPEGYIRIRFINDTTERYVSCLSKAIKMLADKHGSELFLLDCGFTIHGLHEDNELIIMAVYKPMVGNTPSPVILEDGVVFHPATPKNANLSVKLGEDIYLHLRTNGAFSAPDNNVIVVLDELSASFNLAYPHIYELRERGVTSLNNPADDLYRPTLTSFISIDSVALSIGTEEEIAVCVNTLKELIKLYRNDDKEKTLELGYREIVNW